jgi:BirA family biotin operon repressor/biotin-[acetyl-CoA-carboxylase] ligase
LEILCFDELESTQTYLIEELRDSNLTLPIAVMAKEQTNGIGSRDNSWEGGDGNLFFSLAISIDDLPDDLPLTSASIYFSYIMKEVLSEYIEDIWVKWPNDLYYNQHKIGGTITKKMDNIFLCGMGINLQKNSNSFKALNLNVEPITLLKKYLLSVEEYTSWKQIFSQYRVEFGRTREFSAHIEGEYKSLEKAILSEDGSLIIENKRVYNIR